MRPDHDVEGAADLSAPSTDGRRLRALVVGSGYRVRNCYLPALTILGSRVEVVGVHSRNPANARRAAEPFGVNHIEDLRTVRPGDVDIVLVSVTATSNRAVLRATAHLAPGASLVMDTPAFGSWPDLWHLDLYRRWRSVRVAEDFMNLAQFRLIGDVIAGGALGQIRHMRLHNMGYRYHALALMRSWLGFPIARSARGRRSRGGAVSVSYDFPGGVKGEVLEPYTGAEGILEVVGTDAAITTHSMGGAIESNGNSAHGRLERLEEGGRLCGFRLAGLDTDAVTHVAPLAALRDMGLEDDGEFNLLRVDALSRVISSLWCDDPVNTRYRVQDAMADALVSYLSRAVPRWPIPQRPGRNTVELIDAAAARVRLLPG